MIIRGIVGVIKTVISVIAKAVAWLLLALGLWLPAIFAVIFMLVILLTKTPFSAVSNIFYAGLVLSTVISIWFTLSSGKKKSKIKKEKPAPTYLSKIRERENRVEYTMAPPRGSVFREEEHLDLPAEEQIMENKLDFNAIKREHYRQMEEKYGKSFSEPPSPPKQTAKEKRQARKDAKRHPNADSYGGQPDYGRYTGDYRYGPQGSYQGGPYQGGQGAYQSGQGPQFHSYHPERDYQNAPPSLNDYRPTNQRPQFHSYHPERDYQTQKPHLYDNRPDGQGARFSGYNSDYPYQGDYRNEGQGVRFNSYHPERDYEDYHGYHNNDYRDDYGYQRERSDSQYRTGSGIEFRSYHPNNQPSGYNEAPNKSYGQSYSQYSQGYQGHNQPAASGQYEQGGAKDSAQYEPTRKNESPRIFLSRKDSTLLIYEYSDRLEYYRRANGAIVYESTKYKN